MKKFILFLLCFTEIHSFAQTNNKAVENPAALVNVFLGTSADHGQLSPAASAPLSMLSIVPQTYPHIHTGYEYYAKEFLGFAHTCLEGVGCQGSGGNILIKPFLGDDYTKCKLIKASQAGSPGYYSVSFTNRISASFVVTPKYGVHHYVFPKGKKGFYIDLSHTLSNGFVDEQHTISNDTLSGWVEAGTTCSVGKYKIYYRLVLDKNVQWDSVGKHQLIAHLPDEAATVDIRIALSSVNNEYARAAIGNDNFDVLKNKSEAAWNNMLAHVKVTGDRKREALFYSLLYRAIQSPYKISEPDGHYRAIDGSEQISSDTMYNGWSIWDNYKTQLPLLSVLYPQQYKGIIRSVANLYKYGKKDYATQHEPSNTVRTEHAMVALLDAYKKGYSIDFAPIKDSLKNEVDRLDFSHPDKALESSYDCWAFSQIAYILHDTTLSNRYGRKALEYKNYWNKDFKDLTRHDVDRMQARGMYQGTIWQYRWLVPFDVKGLMELAGGEKDFIKQLDTFFGNDYYSHANEPDIQMPVLYNATGEPWKSQYMMHKIAVDTMIQYYFNDNSRGIDSYIGPIYKNEPQAFLRTMDDDAGAMSSWFVFAACGFFPACVGEPVYYLNVPLFKTVTINLPEEKTFTIKVENFSDKNCYIKRAVLNGKVWNKNYITQQDIMNGGTLVIEASAEPAENNHMEKWISSFSLN
ncbi:alpha-mannosidase [Arachidicoccus ginsenosidimutans]|uniref:glycoside hydrolase domain-containing protein n=1 Tax=Arachidicoccus sp. BS20 TaxID=1850526 RepID=UPI0007F074C5|nr:glycoside hydrolase domain-containing protein [Arachidicoccus sp. BS20]ANI90078.1 alpha-mannosidase [Arachidicoccus sp. BS20]